MVKIFPNVKKVINVIANATAHFRPEQKVGFNFSNRTTGTAAKPLVKAGTRWSLSPIVATARQRLGFRFNVNSIIGTIAKPQHKAGLRLRTVLTTTPSQKAGIRVQQVRYNLVHESGATSVTNQNASPSLWAPIGNGTGKKNGTLCSIAGSTTQSRDATVHLQYADFPNKADLTITKVELRYYVRQAGTVLNNGTLELMYGFEPGIFTYAETITGNVDSLTTPRTFDITSEVGGSWTMLDNLVVAIRFVSTALETQTADFDAVHLYIEASRTDSL